MVKKKLKAIIVSGVLIAIVIVLLWPKQMLRNTDTIIMADVKLLVNGHDAVLQSVPESKYESLHSILNEVRTRSTMLFSFSNDEYRYHPSMIVYVSYKTTTGEVRSISISFGTDYKYGPVLVDSKGILRQIVKENEGLAQKILKIIE